MIRAWAPLFRINLGISRAELESMSVPEMLDHLDWYREAVSNGD